jgi:hypothetical protein
VTRNADLEAGKAMKPPNRGPSGSSILIVFTAGFRLERQEIKDQGCPSSPQGVMPVEGNIDA